MKDKEMIEEMANILCENCLSVDGETKCRYLADNSLTNKTFYRACRSARLSEATRLYNECCRKIPEGSVVLYKDEAQKYYAYKIIEPQIKGCLDRERELEKQVAELEEQRDRQAYIAEELIQEKHRWTEQTRKETARNIYKLVDNKLDLYRKGVISGSLYDDGYKSAIYDVKRTIKELFGVEVEE